MAFRTRLCFLLTVVISIVALHSSANGQWTVLKSFGTGIRSIYFLDQQGASSTGFLGLDNSTIWLTTNNGATWYQASTPPYPVPVEVTDFTFNNSLQGWCTVRSSFATGEIWKTTDGGDHWDSCYAGGAFGSIAFCSATNTLVATCWTYGNDMSVRSTDFGATWSAFAPAWLNGATFSGMTGFIGNISAPSPLYSSDGGATWNSAPSDTTETWAPHAIPGSNIVLAVGEKTRQFLKSTDGGATWTNPYTYSAFDYPTGCIQGTLTNLFVQTQSNGFLYSGDSGKSWSHVCGPNTNTDTRFYPKGKEVFAADANGNLWHTSDGSIASQSSLFLGYPSLSISGIHCRTYDSLLYFGAGCGTGVLDSIRIISRTGAFSLANDSVPRAFYSIDSIAILYSPSAGYRDSAKIMLAFVLDGVRIDTSITLYGIGKDSLMYKADTTTVVTAGTCSAIDTSVLLHNTSCDTLTLWNSSITNRPLFSLLPFSLPYKIPPGDSVPIPVTLTPTQPGAFHSMLKFTVISTGFPYKNDSIPITLTVVGAAQPSVTPLALSMLDVCEPLDTVVAIFSSPCDSITILSASLSDTAIFQLRAPAFPVALGPSASTDLSIEIHPISKGMDSTQLHIRYRAGGSIIDTSITLRVHILYDLPLEVSLPDSAIDLGTADAPCEAASRWIAFTNSLCADLSIKRIIWLKSNSQFSFDPLPLPQTLASNGGVDSVLVHFAPNVAGKSTAQLRVTLDLNGTDFDTTITVTATGVLRFHDSVLTPTLTYDSIAECLNSERTGKIIDLSCDSVIAVSATIGGAAGYSVTRPTFPQPLHRGDTLSVGFTLEPNTPGPAADFAIVTLHDLRNDSDYFDTIQLSAYVLAARHALSIDNTAFSFPEITPCTEPDSSFTITNRGCDTIVIADTTIAGYAGIAFVPPLILPLTIAPDSSVSIAFRVFPNRDTLETTDLSLGGTNIDTVIGFRYVALPSPPALALSVPDSNFSTKHCVPISKAFWLANTGCSPASVDSLVLSQIPNASQFKLSGLPPLPTMLQPGDTLSWDLTFDPNGNGTGTAELTIGTGAKVRLIPLAGSVVGSVPTARIAIESYAGSTQSSGVARDTTSIIATLLDGIGDTTSLSTVTLALAANWNVLTPRRFSAAPGWSVLSTAMLSNGEFSIRLQHTTPGAVAAGTILVDIACIIDVSDSNATAITLTNSLFNSNDSAYESCVLSSIPMSGSPILFTELDTCGTPELRDVIEHHLALRIVSIQPNPAPLVGSAAEVTVTFDLAADANVRFSVRDMVGRELSGITRAFRSGRNTFALALPCIAEGTYFVTLEAAGSSANSRVLVMNGAELGAPIRSEPQR